MVANSSIAGIIVYFEDLSVLIRVSRHNRDHLAQFESEAVISAQKGERYQKALTEPIQDSESILHRTDGFLLILPSDHIASAAQRLRNWLNSDKKAWADLFARACALRDAVQTKLKQCYAYIYPRQGSDRLNVFAEDWQSIVHAFPSARTDAHSALDCWALQHPTASIFYSMRVVEVRCLALERKLKLPRNKSVEWATWQEILIALDGEIKRIGVQMKAGKSKDLALAFYSGARADLNGFKDEFRNSMMHVRTEYNDRQAERAITQVQAFMGRLAGRISEAKRTQSLAKRKSA